MLRSLRLMKCILKSHHFLQQSYSCRLRFLHSIYHRPCFGPQLLSKSFHVQVTACRPDTTSIDRHLLQLDDEIRKKGRVNRREIEDILEDMREMKTATRSQSLMIIRCCGDLVPEETPENRTKLVQEIWKTMENLNVPMDISHYNALLKVYLENEYKFSPTEFLQDLSNKEIEANRVTYQRLISRYCQEGDIEGASTILQHMKDKQLPINEHVFNALVLGHAQVNDMENALGIVSVMKQAGLEPTDDTYVSLMIGYAKNGDIQNVHRIVKECNDKEIFLFDRDFLSTIYTLAANNYDSAVDEVLPYLRKQTGFNQEAINTILKLVNLGKLEIAYKILQQMARIVITPDEQAPCGHFFIKQMVQSGIPSETIIKYCKEMEVSKLNKYALLKSVELAVRGKKFEKATDLLEALYESGFPMRQHFFWPFFATSSTEKNVYDGLKCMALVEQLPNMVTLRDYVIPAMLKACPKQPYRNILEKLCGYTRLPISNVVFPFFQHLIDVGDLNGAATFVSRFKLKMPLSTRRFLIEKYMQKADAKSVAKILGSVEGDDETLRESVGAFLLELLECSRDSQKLQYLEPLLQELLNQGLGISNSAAELIQNNLGEHWTAEISNYLVQLTAGDLERKLVTSHSSDDRKYKVFDEKGVADLEEMLEGDKKRGRSNRSLQVNLLTQYCIGKNFEKAEALKKEMLDDDMVLSTYVKTKLFELYCDSNNVELAQNIHTDIMATQPEFIFDDSKFLKYVLLLVTNGHQEEALQVIKNQKRNEAREPGGYNQNILVWKILNALAESGNVETTKEAFQALVDRGLTRVTNTILGPLVTVHLIKDDLVGALDEFERCVQEYQQTPMKQRLLCVFIKSEDSERLQKLLDLSATIHGEVNNLYDLIFAFLECGKVRQAKKIVDALGFRVKYDKVDYICQRYVSSNRLSEVEKFVEITRDVYGIDRNALYFHLLKAYCANGDADKALGVWTSLQEENVQPSEELLVYLANFLLANGKPVPFVIPVTASSEPLEKSKTLLRKYRKALESNQVDSARIIKKEIEAQGGENVNVHEESKLIFTLIKQEKLNQAVRLIEDMATKGMYPTEKVLRKLTDKLGDSGDFETIKSLHTVLPPRGAVHISIPLALINCGKGQEYFNEYVKKPIENLASGVMDSKIEISVTDTFRLLEKNPEFLPQVEECATKSRQYGNHRLLNTLWLHHLATKNFTKAKELFDEIKQSEDLVYSPIYNYPLKNPDVKVAEVLWNQIQDSSSSDRLKAFIVSNFINVCQASGDVERALKVLNKALKKFKIQDLRYYVLRSLKTKMEEDGQKFPYLLPPKSQIRSERRRSDKPSSDNFESFQKNI